MEIDVECPSGMVGRIRPIKVKDEVLYTDAKLSRSGRLVDELVSRCFVELKHPGPYTFPGGKIDWNSVLQGDVFFLFFALRRLSYGDNYDVTLTCQACQQTIEETVDLSTLKAQPLPDESRACLQTGEPLAPRVGEGPKVKFRLLMQGDEKHIRAIKETHGVSPRYAPLVRRIVEIEGVGGSPRAILDYVQDLSAGEAETLLNAVEEHDCGVNTDIQIICDSCGTEQMMTLPLSVNFFRTAGRKKKPEPHTEIG